MGKDYYKILGVSKDATAKQLRTAYKKLAMQWHPDKHQQSGPGGREKAENMFKDIAEAYDVLSDENKRRIYDVSGEDGLKGGRSGPGGASHMHRSTGGIRTETFYNGVDPGDLFSRFFGASASFGFDDDFTPFNDFAQMHQTQSPKSVEEHEIKMNVTLEELYDGAKKKMKVNRARWVNNTRRLEDKILDIEIKRGWKDGTRITFKGEGQQNAPNHPAGNLIFVIQTAQHPRFARNGDHLVYKATVSLKDCFTGTVVQVLTLDKRLLNVRAPAIITPTTRRVIAGEGMPSQKTGEKGDLIVEFAINFPQAVSEAQLEAIIAALR